MLSSRLLIIDDDQSIIETLSQMLRLEGHDVRTANNAELGLDEARARELDAIIVDLRMPFINGLGFLYRLRSLDHHQRTPVAMITGDYSVDEEVARELEELGAELHYKPIWLDEVAALVQSMVVGRRDMPPEPCQPGC
jgi:DNA-binding response OmpR family regulator